MPTYLPFDPDIITQSSSLMKTSLIESESGNEQRISHRFFNKKKYLLQFTNVSVDGTIAANYTTIPNGYRLTNGAINPNFNLVNMVNFFEKIAKGRLNSFTLHVRQPLIKLETTVRFDNDELTITYINRNYCDFSIEVITC